MKNYSDHYRERTGASGGEEAVYLLEITHPQLAVPVRINNSTEDITSNGHLFVACAFRVSFPDDVNRSMPRVPISIDNVGRELTQWIDGSNGGRGAEMTLMQVMADTPDVVEQSYTMTLLGVHQNMMEVTGTLGYENVMDQPCLPATYTPETCPALF